MEKVNTRISCKANHIDETHLEFKAKKNQKKSRNTEPTKKIINYTVENAKLKNDIKELKEQNKKNNRYLRTKISMQLPMKHLSCNKIVNNKMVVRLKTLSKFAPSLKTSSQQLLKKDIEKIINHPRNCLKSSDNLSTFYCTKGALSNTKTTTEIPPSPCNLKRNTIKLSKKINRALLSSQEDNLNTLYSESRNMNYALNSDDYVSDLKKYFYQYPKKRNQTDLSNMFTIRKKEPFTIYIKSHLFLFENIRRANVLQVRRCVFEY